MANDGGKAFERRTAREIGGKRTVGSGAYRQLDLLGDVTHDIIYAECKHRADRWKEFFNVVEKCEEEASMIYQEGQEKVKKKLKKIPVNAFKKKSKGLKGFYWVVHSDNLEILARERIIARKCYGAGYEVGSDEWEEYARELRAWWDREVGP